MPTKRKTLRFDESQSIESQFAVIWEELHAGREIDVILPRDNPSESTGFTANRLLSMLLREIRRGKLARAALWRMHINYDT